MFRRMSPLSNLPLKNAPTSYKKVQLMEAGTHMDFEENREELQRGLWAWLWPVPLFEVVEKEILPGPSR